MSTTKYHFQKKTSSEGCDPVVTILYSLGSLYYWITRNVFFLRNFIIPSCSPYGAAVQFINLVSSMYQKDDPVEFTFLKFRPL